MMGQLTEKLYAEVRRARHSALRAAFSRRIRGRLTAWSFNLSTQDVLDMFLEQYGLCVVSGISLNLCQDSGWRMSLERFDNQRGYERNNCGLICHPFQSSDYTPKHCVPELVHGSPQWS